MKRKDFYIGLWILLIALTVLAGSISLWESVGDYLMHTSAGCVFFGSIIMLVITLFWKEK